MQTDLVGRLRHVQLPKKNFLQPVYEAVINSIEAIEEAGAEDGRIEVIIEREAALSDLPDGSGYLPDVIGFQITDNGIGFTTKNFTAFETLDTLAKVDRGGKGIGRITWLKAFEKAAVESRYIEDGAWRKRSFDFLPTRKGIENVKQDSVDEDGNRPQTTVRLIDFKEPYRSAAPKTVRTLAHHMIEHLLQFFVLDQVPTIVLRDPSQNDVVNLNVAFNEIFQPKEGERGFEVGGHRFRILDVYLRADHAPAHALNFCGNGRVVTSIKLEKRIPHLGRTIEDADGNPLVYTGYIQADLLDRRINELRTGFTFERRGAVSATGIVWDDIEQAGLAAAEEFLSDVTQQGREESRARIQAYVREDAPRYRALLQRRSAEVDRISANTLSEGELEAELNRLYTDWKVDLQEEAREKLATMDEDDEELLGSFHEKIGPLLVKLQEAAKGELAEYVVRRRVVLDFFQKLLRRKSDGKYPAESQLHSLVFPLRKTSDEVDYEEHNLWLVDERLAFHHFLASDLPLNKEGHAITAETSKRPDLLILNRKMTFAEDDFEITSAVIVEFKRPERKSYPEDDKPVRQVIEYLGDLRSGKIEDRHGQPVRLSESVPLYCYLIGSFTEQLLEDIRIDGNFTRTPDGDGFFRYHNEFRAYVEVLSYEKVLRDAKKRNRAFIEHLLPLSGSIER